MNNRIKKLAIASGALEDEGELILVGNNIETFAKVIVEKCCYLCTYPDIDDEQSYYANLFAEQLREYFGIE